MGSVEEAEAAVGISSRSTSGSDSKSKWQVKFADADVGKGGGTSSRPQRAAVGCKGGAARRSQSDVAPASVPPSDNLYVKGLTHRVTEPQLRRTFSRAGKVVELKILRYGDSHECSALVRMESVEAAEAAIELLQGTAPEGGAPTLTIRFHGKDHMPSDNLYVKGLPLHFTQGGLQALVGEYGVVRRSRILAPPQRHTVVDAAALVQMGSVAEADRVIQMLNGRAAPGAGRVMAIRFADAKAEARSDQEPTDNLYVKGLPLGTPDATLRSVFGQYGHVVRLKVLEPKNGESSDCAALVQLGSVEEAMAAVEALHGRVLKGPVPRMKVKFAGKNSQPVPNLYVAGLPHHAQEQQVRAMFSQCGAVARLRLLSQPGSSETHALVQMGSVDEAQEAIQRFSDSPSEALGPTLVVRYATNKGPSLKMLEDSGSSPVASAGQAPQSPCGPGAGACAGGVGAGGGCGGCAALGGGPCGAPCVGGGACAPYVGAYGGGQCAAMCGGPFEGAYQGQCGGYVMQAGPCTSPCGSCCGGLCGPGPPYGGACGSCGGCGVCGGCGGPPMTEWDCGGAQPPAHFGGGPPTPPAADGPEAARAQTALRGAAPGASRGWAAGGGFGRRPPASLDEIGEQEQDEEFYESPMGVPGAALSATMQPPP